MEKLVHSQTPIEFFKELVDEALARQGLSSSELSAYYLVHVLEQFVASDDLYAELEVEKGTTLAELLCEALAARGGRQLTMLKFTGDLALFVSGFFSDSIARRRVDLDYYVRMGGYAYRRAAVKSSADASEVFLELSSKFVRFVDVLNEVSEKSSLGDSTGILRLYERWLQTGSPRSESLLRQEGILLGQANKRVH